MPNDHGVAAPSVPAAAELLDQISRHAKTPQPGISWVEVLTELFTANTRAPRIPKIPTKPLRIAASHMLKDVQNSGFGAVNNSNIRFILGSIAKSAMINLSTGQFSSHQAFRFKRGALTGYKLVPKLNTGESSHSLEANLAIALWTLGLLVEHETHGRIVSRPALTRAEKRELGISTRWVSGFHVDRIRDLKLITKPTPSTWESIDRILKWSNLPQPDLIDLNFASPEIKAPMSSKAETLIRLMWPKRLGYIWQELKDLDTLDIELLLTTEELCASRGDLVINENSALIIEPQGYYDALLTACVGIAGDEMNQQWHEREVAAAVRATWKESSKIYTNVEWTDTNPELSPHVVVRGEFDSLAVSKDLLVDFQAKSARSAQAKNRESTTVKDAFNQHRALSDALETGVWAIKPSKKTNPHQGYSRIAKFGCPPLTHVPITVGTEPVHLWSIGASSKENGLVQVLTTLDHLRVVNQFVPDIFRATYWLDRFAQEFGPLQFVDEIDFLDKWSTYLQVDGNVRQFEIVDCRLVMASDSDIERSIVRQNNLIGYPDNLNITPQVAGSLVGRKLNYLNVSITSPNLYKILKELRSTAPHDQLLLCRMILGTDLTVIEAAIRARQNTIFPGGIVPWAIQFGNHSAVQVRTKSDYPWAVLKCISGSWSLSRLASADDFRRFWTMPRISLSE